jgi:hypothetical protein
MKRPPRSGSSLTSNWIMRPSFVASSQITDVRRPPVSVALSSKDMAKHSSHIVEMARKGADHRYEELKAEIANLVKSFPHLAQGTRKRVSKAVSRGVVAVEAEVPTMRRQAKTMSAAARKAVSTRMKKYWAARRAAKK